MRLKRNNGSDRVLSNSINLKFKSFGERNPDKFFYIIYGSKSGFFSNLQFVLAHIRCAESLGMIPFVDFKNFPNIYNEKKEIHGTTNSWEYYFENICEYSLDEIYQSKNVFFCDGKYSWAMGYYLSDKNLFHYYKKYIRPGRYISDEISGYQKELFGNQRILGIHFRGNEQNVTSSHPFCPTVKQMIKYADMILNKHQIDKIFLVTEEKKYFEIFIKKYGDKLLSTQYSRTYGINGSKLNPPTRENHIYLLGKEIMIGGYLLSYCTGLLHSSSNVSAFAIFNNDNKYEFRYNIVNGVNSSIL